MVPVIRSLLSVALVLVAAAPPAAAQAREGEPPVGRDSKPHRSAYVSHQGVRLHYLEWGEDERVVVLLPGYALTAHAFDEIAQQLADRFRVIAVTPRGFGESGAPDSGDYTIATMAADLRALLDTLGVARAALVGHSISGSTIAEFASAHPDRVSELIFLDAFPYYAAAGGDSIDALNPVTAEAFSGEMTHPRVREFLARYRFGGWNAALEADLHANELGDELMRRLSLTDGYVRDQRANPPDLGRITVRALQICAIATVSSEYPWLAPGTAEHGRAEKYVRDVLQPFNHRLCSRFESDLPTGRTIKVTGSHYVFFTRPELAARAIRAFLE